jgi:putative tryptophan/tyrosine transport system substrate-binding protein
VVALTGDPLGQGIAQTLAHPGGNITGVSVDAGPSIQEKRIELLRGLVPAMTTLGVIVLRRQWEAGAEETMRAGCHANGIRCVPALLDLPTDDTAYRQAVAAAQRGGAEALIIADNPDAFVNNRAIIDAAAAARLPSMYFLREFIEAGGLMAYSFDLIALNEQAARDIHAILGGARPGEIPFFQNTRFNLYINLTTAKALGLTVPQSLLARADEVIE